MKTIKTKGNQVFNVPNDKEGQLFMYLASKFLNKNNKLRRRGRGKRKSVGDTKSYCKVKNAEWFAIYFNDSVVHRELQKSRKDYYELYETNLEFRKFIKNMYHIYV